MSEALAELQALLRHWRKHGAGRLDPLRFQHLAGLCRRAQAAEGSARRLLEQRLAELVAGYGPALDQAIAPSPAASGAEAGLGPVVATLHARGAAHGYPELAMLEEVRERWAQARSEDQLRQSLQQVPADAGPLNSGKLVHRALNLMREVSPDYLQQFVGYLDNLAWLEQLGQAAAPTPAPTDGARKSRRKKA